MKLRLMPYPCSHFYFDIQFGNRLYSEEKRPGSPFTGKTDSTHNKRKQVICVQQ